MIKLENVNKYFNRYKKNQIHVINNTSIDFNKTGLVAILGPSGCGKTTLLNTIGGLDKVSSGNIYIDGKKITKRNVNEIDKIRNLKIGYIFQDYKLIDNLSVFDNVAISLKLIGIKDKEEIKKRVMYTLEKVNMARYKNRPASMLSGGEKQRVGIARAIVKNPSIILADEPTGNLDSKNSLEIMNIIKKLSNNYLVILVTHEEELARFYATHIIELKDGLIEKTYPNRENKKLNYKLENRFYLKDFPNILNIEKDHLHINIYKDNNDDININLVFKNGNIYIEDNNQNKIEVIDQNSSIELINDHYQEIEEIDNDIDFDIEEISNKTKLKYSSIFKLGSYITSGFQKIFSYPFLKKLLLGGFFISGMFIFYAISSIFATLNIKEEEYITVNKDYLNVTSNITIDDYLNYEKLDNINYLIPGDSIINFILHYDKYLQTANYEGLLSSSLSDIATIKEDDLFKGRMPINNNEVVVDKLVIDRFIKDNNSLMSGFMNEDDFLNQKIFLKNNLSYSIVGITNLNEPNIYMPKKDFLNIISNSYPKSNWELVDDNISILDYKLFDDIKLVKGNYPTNDYEVIINSSLKDIYPLDKELDLKINNHNLVVKGYYEADFNYYLVNNNTIKYKLINDSKEITISSQNKDKTINYFKNINRNIKDAYDYDKTKYLNSKKDSIINTLTLSFVILIISLIEIILIIRASFLSRIKEVGIYRAIGLKKSDIYKMFVGEIIAITSLASIPGVLFMSYILYCLKGITLLSSLYIVNILTISLSILLIFIFNVIVGLLPVYNIVRLTPATILARNDID